MMEPDLSETLATSELLTLSDHPFKLGGHDALYIGLTVTLYFGGPYVEGINEKLCQCLDEYIALAPFPPKSAGLPSSKQWIDLTKRGLIFPIDAVSKLDEKRSWSANYVWSAGEDDAYPYEASAVRGSSTETWALSYLHVAFPVRWVDDPRLLLYIRQWSERLQVLHGYVGLAPILPASMSAERRSETDVFLAAKRFPGLNVDIPASHRGPLVEGIKTVDWITLLGKKYGDVLGGQTALQAKLGAKFSVTELRGGGLMIQAGPLPSLGDLSKNERPPLYVELNRELKPVRVPNYPYAFQSGQFTRPYMDRDAAKAWIARLD